MGIESALPPRALTRALSLLLVVAACSNTPQPSAGETTISLQAEIAGADNPLGIASLGFILVGGQATCPLDVTRFDASGKPTPAHDAVGSAVVAIRPDLVTNSAGGVSRLSDEALFARLPVGDYTACAYVLDQGLAVIPECTVASASGHLAARTKLPLRTDSLCYPPGTQGVNIDGTVSYATYFDLRKIEEETCAGGSASLTGAVVSLDGNHPLYWRVSHVQVFPPDAVISWSVDGIDQWQTTDGLVQFSATLDRPGSASFVIDTKDSLHQGLSFTADFAWFEVSERLAIPLAGVQSSVWSDDSVSLAVALQNISDQLDPQVTVTDVIVAGGQRITPDKLPLPLGDLVPDDSARLDARFTVPTLGVPYDLKVRGTWQSGGGTCAFNATGAFTPARPSQEPVQATLGVLTKLTAKDAVYPPAPPPQDPEREFNALGFLPPQGEPRNLFQDEPASTGLAGNGKRVVRNQANVVFTHNTLGATYGGFPPDPSVAGSNGDDVVLFTANTAISYSVDGGATFTTINPFSLVDPAIPGRTTFFPQDFGGLCCDQVLHYVPRVNLFFWLTQYWPKRVGTDSAGNAINGPGLLRIAWASPEGIRADFLHAWSWVDLSSAAVGLGNDWMDFPDLAFSNGWLYVGVDHAIANTGSVYTGRHVYARLSLADIANPASGTVAYWWMDPTHGGLFQHHIVQSSPDTMYFMAQPDTSTVTVYAWPDSSGSATPHDIHISSFSNTDYSAPTPEGIDWNAAPKAILGATYVAPAQFCAPTGCQGPSRFLYLAFSAGRSGSGRPYPYVRVEKIDADAFALVSELDIWNGGVAFSTPALVSNPDLRRDEVALSLAVGGGGSFANNAVGFLGDFLVFVTTNSDTTQAVYNRDSRGNVINDSQGRPTYGVRFGDYYSVRNSIGPPTDFGRGTGYSTLGYASKTAVSGSKWVDVGGHIDLHYVQFGRPGDLFPPPPPP